MKHLVSFVKAALLSTCLAFSANALAQSHTFENADFFVDVDSYKSVVIGVVNSNLQLAHDSDFEADVKIYSVKNDFNPEIDDFFGDDDIESADFIVGSKGLKMKTEDQGEAADFVRGVRQASRRGMAAAVRIMVKEGGADKIVDRILFIPNEGCTAIVKAKWGE